MRKAFFLISSSNGVSSDCRHPVLIFDSLHGKRLFFPMSHQNSSGLNLISEVFFSCHHTSFHLAPTFFAPSHETAVVAVRSIWLSLAAEQTQPLSLLWLLSHRGRPLMASFQCVNSCQVLESPTTALSAGPANTQQREKLLQLPGYSLSTTGGFQKCWPWAKTEPCTPKLPMYSLV